MPSSTSDQADSHMINPLLLEPVRTNVQTDQNRPALHVGPPFAYAHSMPNFRSASSCSWASLSRLDLVFDTHTPSFTTTGSVSLSTAISSAWLRGTGRWAPSRSTHCV